MGLEFQYLDGQTPLNEEEIDGLIVMSITTQGELNEFEQLNIERAVEWTIHKNLSTNNILSESLLRTCIGECMGMFGDGRVNSGNRTRTLVLNGHK